jgi:hypothetical protein
MALPSVPGEMKLFCQGCWGGACTSSLGEVQGNTLTKENSFYYVIPEEYWLAF